MRSKGFLIPGHLFLIELTLLHSEPFLVMQIRKKKSSRNKEASPLRTFQERSRPQLADISVENLSDGVTMHNYCKFDVNCLYV
jgi:hypothetical protein